MIGMVGARFGILILDFVVDEVKRSFFFWVSIACFLEERRDE